MRTALKTTLDVFRWPIGLIALIGLPSAIQLLGNEFSPFLRSEEWPFWAGLILVLILWASWWKETRWARFITTIEHEILHAIVGMLTLIPVRELKVREDGSGHVLFEPPGHWLLYLAPYFIPLLLVVEIGLTRLIGLPEPLESGVLGAVFGLSVLGHVRQIHPRQTDFKSAGRVFTLTFLPTAFLLSYGAAFTVLQEHELAAIPDYLGRWSIQSYHDLLWCITQVSGWISL